MSTKEERTHAANTAMAIIGIGLAAAALSLCLGIKIGTSLAEGEAIKNKAGYYHHETRIFTWGQP